MVKPKYSDTSQTASLKDGLTFGTTLDLYRKDGSKKAVDKMLHGEGLFGDSLGDKRAGNLSDKFMIPPLTVLNARDGYWQNRKRAWLALGIQSELGRGDAGDDEPALPELAPLPELAQLDDLQQAAQEHIAEAVGISEDSLLGRKPPKAQPPITIADVKPVPREPAKPVKRGGINIVVGNVTAKPKVTRTEPKAEDDTGSEETHDPVRKPPSASQPAPKLSGIVISGKNTAAPPATKRTLVLPIDLYREQLAKAKGQPMTFDDTTWFIDPPRSAIGLDVETYKNFFLVNLKRFVDGKKLSFEFSDRCPDFDRSTLSQILASECIITFRGNEYDMPMIALALKPKTDNYMLKEASDALILEGLKSWDFEKRYDTRRMKVNHVDLEQATPSVASGLKLLYARTHGKVIMDLPFDPHKYLSPEEMNVTTLYCFNDLDATEQVFNWMVEPLKLRVAIGKQYDIDVRSKSDAQIGEAIIKKRVEAITGKTVKKGANDMKEFGYTVPDFINFRSKQMQDVLTMLADARFYVGTYGIDMPAALKGLQITMGPSTFTMGVGGLHSTEANRSVHAGADHKLKDIDVSSQYPAILLKLGKYPLAVGKAFLEVYRGIYDERLAGKDRTKYINEKLLPNLDKLTDAIQQELDKLGIPVTELGVALKRELETLKVKVEGLKIALNGVYGKLGSIFSFLFGPDIMIAVTLTGQLSLLMLIEMLTEADLPVVSGNTDGVVVRCPNDRVGDMDAIIAKWESATGFVAEQAEYVSLYNQSVNSYIAVKADGKVKIKGPVANPWGEGDKRAQLSKNPQMTICTDALVAYIKDKTPFADTIQACKDVRQFVTVNKVTNGATWQGTPLGKVIRYYWGTNGEPLYTTNKNSTKTKVSKTSGAVPLPVLPDALPTDIDYARYVDATTTWAYEMGVMEKPTLLNRGNKNG